jgi:hypothetical protein
MIQLVASNLSRFGKHTFGFSEALIRIERWPINRALEQYKKTLLSVPARTEAEPPSATMIRRATISWSEEDAEIGKKIRQKHLGEVHPEMRDTVDRWFDAGKPFPSSGGIYHTIPNKSYEKVKNLAQYPELRDAVINLRLEDEWLRFWDIYLPRRYDVSRMMLQQLLSGADPEVFERNNLEAGTGLYIRGRRLKRKDLKDVGSELEFLLKYSFYMGIAFAAVQIAELPPDKCFVVVVKDPRIKGAIAARSDMEVLDAQWDGELLSIEGIAQTRQAGSDSSGVLSNSYTERKLMQQSVTEQVHREYKGDRVEYPFTAKDKLLQVWGLDAKPFPGRQYVIGQDMGLMEPIKAPADALFSRAFLAIGSKVVAMMLSGSGWTQAVYAVFHNYFASLLDPGDYMMCLGDDMNAVTATATEERFDPYRKVKSTNPEQNTKKILGMYSAFSPSYDPSEQQPATLGVVPRVLKTISSATKRASRWQDLLSDLKPTGTMEIEQDEATLNLIRDDLPIIRPYMLWHGKRAELMSYLRSRWAHIPSVTWNVLRRHMDEIEHRIHPHDELEEIAE